LLVATVERARLPLVELRSGSLFETAIAGGVAMRAVNIVLGVALGILWLAGLNAGVAPWLVWLDFIVALAAIAVGVVPAATRAEGAYRASDVAFGVVLLALWIVALAAGVTSWMAWWTFAFGIAFLVAGASAPGIELPLRPSHPSRA
jgi:hypothetical protein